jgi:hypothetical protein
MNQTLLLWVLFLSLVIAVYRVIRTVLVERAVSHGMSEHEAQKRYESIFHILWFLRKDRKKKEELTKQETKVPKEEVPRKRSQTRWTSLPRREQ